jgi:hypothetical protein
MSSAPARGRREDGPGDGWQPLAKRVAAQARDFLDGVGALATEQGGDEVVPLLLLEVSRSCWLSAQLGESGRVPPGNWEPDVGPIPISTSPGGLAARLVNCDEYAGFSTYADTRPTAFRLSDDLAAVAADLIHGLQHYEAGRSLEGPLVVAILLRQPLGHPRGSRAARPARHRRPRPARCRRRRPPQA